MELEGCGDGEDDNDDGDEAEYRSLAWSTISKQLAIAGSQNQVGSRVLVYDLERATVIQERCLSNNGNVEASVLPGGVSPITTVRQQRARRSLRQASDLVFWPGRGDRIVFRTEGMAGAVEIYDVLGGKKWRLGAWTEGKDMGLLRWRGSWL